MDQVLTDWLGMVLCLCFLEIVTKLFHVVLAVKVYILGTSFIVQLFSNVLYDFFLLQMNIQERQKAICTVTHTRLKP
jgi:hypothetical protein